MKICILGENLTSLALAKSLINVNLSVDLITSKNLKLNNKSRTIGISKTNFKYFCDDIFNIRNLSWNINSIQIYTDNNLKKDLINFKDSNQLFFIVKNNDIQKVLLNSLKKTKKFRKISKLEKKNYQLIINCDFHHPVTKKFFSKRIEKNYNSYAYTTILKHKELKNNQAIQVFTKNGPIAFLPISNCETSIVYSLNKKKQIDKREFLNLIKKYNNKYVIKNIIEFGSFYLKSSNLRSYYNKNILAFGDLLHRIHPLAGQGYNMTLRDIKILTNLIKEKQKLGLGFDSSIFSEFEKITKSKNYLFSQGIDFIYEFFNFERKINNKFLNSSVSVIAKNQLLNKTFKLVADVGTI